MTRSGDLDEGRVSLVWETGHQRPVETPFVDPDYDGGRVYFRLFYFHFFKLLLIPAWPMVFRFLAGTQVVEAIYPGYCNRSHSINSAEFIIDY